MSRQIILYDTTLRDGTQGEQVNMSAEDKLRIAQKLDDFGIHYIEGGWPGSNPKDARFFDMAKKVSFHTSKLTAFGSTCKPRTAPEKDASMMALLDTNVEVATIFGKSWDIHATDILQVSLDENLFMIEDTVRFLKKHGIEVVYDAEHFFDGFIHNPDYAIKTIRAAINGGAEFIALCDTNGGTLPWDVERIVSEVARQVSTPLGIHTHNDCGLALANSIVAVRKGVTMVQGTINGYGERCGNADLIGVIGNLQIKMGYRCIKPEKQVQLTELSRFVSEIANIPPLSQRPFVGKSAFAHKAGVHVSAILKNPIAYEHIEPGTVGNRRRVLVSDLSGKSNIEYKAKELGIELDDQKVDSQRIVQKIKKMEDSGYQFEAAEGSLWLLINKATNKIRDAFILESFRVSVEKDKSQSCVSHATIKISVGGEEEITAAEGDGPVNALDNALKKALSKFFPEVNEMGLVDFRVRVIDGREGTASKVRVRIESRDDKEIWATIGVSENIIEASWQALMDSVEYKLAKSSQQ